MPKSRKAWCIMPIHACNHHTKWDVNVTSALNKKMQPSVWSFFLGSATLVWTSLSSPWKFWKMLPSYWLKKLQSRVFYQSQPKSQTDFTLSLLQSDRNMILLHLLHLFFPKSKTPTQTRVRSETEAMKTTPKNICFPTNLIKTTRTKSCTKLGLSTTDWNN